MKILIQIGIITAICFAGEILSVLLPFPVPSGVYGLILLFLLLCLGIIKPIQIQEISDFFMSILPILFISPSVKLMTSWDLIADHLIAILVLLFLSTVCVTAVTGLTAQAMLQREANSGDELSKDGEGK